MIAWYCLLVPRQMSLEMACFPVYLWGFPRSKGCELRAFQFSSYLDPLFPVLPLSCLELLASHMGPALVKTPEGRPLSPLTLYCFAVQKRGASPPLCRGLTIAVAKQQEVEVAEDNAVLS